MNRQDAIVYVFNDSIKRNLGLNSVKYYGVCEKINTQDKSKLYGEFNGLKEEVFIDDLYENFYFHLNNSNSISNGYDNGFGDSPLISNTNKNTLIFFSSNRNGRTDEDIYQAIISAIPVEILQANRRVLKVQKITIDPIDYDKNKEDVFSRFFKSYTNKGFHVDYCLIAINYNLSFQYQSNCIDMCKKEQLVLIKNCDPIVCARDYGNPDYVTCEYSV